MKCFWIYLCIYICTHIYFVCVCVCRISTQILQSFIGSSTSVSRTPGFKVLRSRIKVTAEDKGLAWCTFPCAGPSLLDSGNLQHMAYCMDQSHSSCHRSWHIRGHRYHTQHRAYTGWLKKKGDKGEPWRNGHVISPSARCHSAGPCPSLWRRFLSTGSPLCFNKGVTKPPNIPQTLWESPAPNKRQHQRATSWASALQKQINEKLFIPTWTNYTLVSKAVRKSIRLFTYWAQYAKLTPSSPMLLSCDE